MQSASPKSDSASAAITPDAVAALHAPNIPADDWQLEADLRQVHRLVEELRRPGRVDEPVALVSAPHLPAPVAAAATKSAEPPAKGNFWAWSLVSLGLATFACGAVLLGWSFAAGRDDLWPLGMPLALAGQAGLIVGLILQLDGLWQSNRRTEKTLGDLDEELGRVRHATTLLSTNRSTSGQSFYAHLAEGASPQLLLADLKGQLDLLAQQMASRR
jgi:hypothetical protein